MSYPQYKHVNTSQTLYYFLVSGCFGQICKGVFKAHEMPDSEAVKATVGFQLNGCAKAIKNFDRSYPNVMSRANKAQAIKVSPLRSRIRGAENSLKLYTSLGLKTH